MADSLFRRAIGDGLPVRRPKAPENESPGSAPEGEKPSLLGDVEEAHFEEVGSSGGAQKTSRQQGLHGRRVLIGGLFVFVFLLLIIVLAVDGSKKSPQSSQVTQILSQPATPLQKPHNGKQTLKRSSLSQTPGQPAQPLPIQPLAGGKTPQPLGSQVAPIITSRTPSVSPQTIQRDEQAVKRAERAAERAIKNAIK